MVGKKKWKERDKGTDLLYLFVVLHKTVRNQQESIKKIIKCLELKIKIFTK